MKKLLTCEALTIKNMFNDGIYVNDNGDIKYYSFSGLNYTAIHFGIDEKGTFIFLPGLDIEKIYIEDEYKTWSFYERDLSEDLVKQILDKSVRILEAHNTPQPFNLTLSIDLYNLLGKDYWSIYEDLYKKLKIGFIDNDSNKLFLLENGELKEVND